MMSVTVALGYDVIRSCDGVVKHVALTCSCSFVGD